MKKVWFAVRVFVVLALTIAFQPRNIFATLEKHRDELTSEPELGSGPELSSEPLRGLEHVQPPGTTFLPIPDDAPAEQKKPDLVPPKQLKPDPFEVLTEAFSEANREMLLQKVYEKSWKAFGRYKAKKREARLRRSRGEDFEAEKAEEEAKKLEKEYAEAEIAAEERARELYEEWGLPWSGSPMGVWPSEDYVPPADDYGA
ncbi:MAG: hypothetical protein HY584_04185 [Candidatus Omnitrophica bacterium]|nr:hypothetical protein [Candidatus Omnitrophota bacterium]